MKTREVYFASNSEKMLAYNTEKISNSADLIFDRVINLKFTATNKDGLTEEFVIRSDFEAVYPKKNLDAVLKQDNHVSNMCSFRKCQYKPNIKVQYQQVAGSTMVALDIYVSNFFMFSRDGNCLMQFDSDNYTLQKVEIMMGYFGQFTKTFNPQEDGMDKFFTFKATEDIDKIDITNALYVTVDKLPPDYMLHIHGYVGNTFGKPVDVQKEIKSFSDVLNSDIEFELNNTTLEKVLHNCITRRFVQNEMDLPKKSGKSLLSETEAKNIGVQIHLSDTLKNIKITSENKDGNGAGTPNKLVINKGADLECALREISSNVFNFLYKMCNNGSVVVYSSLDILDSSGNPNVAGIKKLSALIDSSMTNAVKNRQGQLPAVVNINVGAVSTIVCPYFGFLEPFQNFNFASRYSLSSIVTYYVGAELATYDFYALNVAVSFATVEDLNEMQIKAVTTK